MKLIPLITLVAANLLTAADENKAQSEYYSYVKNSDNSARYVTQLEWKDFDEKSEIDHPPHEFSFYIKKAFEHIGSQFTNHFDEFPHPSYYRNVSFHSIVNLDDKITPDQPRRWYVVVSVQENNQFIQVVMDMNGKVFPITKCVDQNKSKIKPES